MERERGSRRGMVEKSEGAKVFCFVKNSIKGERWDGKGGGKGKRRGKGKYIRERGSGEGEEYREVREFGGGKRRNV